MRLTLSEKYQIKQAAELVRGKLSAMKCIAEHKDPLILLNQSRNSLTFDAFDRGWQSACKEAINLEVKMAKYVGGYLTKDGKFFEDRELAERHEAKMEFIEIYDKSGHRLMCCDELNNSAIIVPPEAIYSWITAMPNLVLQQFKALVKDIEYTSKPENADE